MNAELKKIIEDSNNIVLFTGAGISCASGIPDFRSANGLYNEKTAIEFPPERIISDWCLKEHPETFFEFYKSKMIYKNALPNVAHKFFAKLEKQGKLKAVITQNIDNLHQKAGSKNVQELHGSVERNYCVNCGKKYDLDYILSQDGVPRCKKCGGMVRPDVVLYGEMLDMTVIEKAINYIAQADCLIIVGTSLTVQPAASMVKYFKGRKLVLINKESTPYDRYANLVINDSIENVIL